MKDTIQLLSNNQNTIDIIRTVVESCGLSIVVTSEINELFHVAVHVDPCLLIIDDSFGVSTASKAVRVLRKTPLLMDLAVLVVLSRFNEYNIKSLIDSGIDELLVSPYNYDIISLRINSVIKNVYSNEAYEELIRLNTNSMNDVQTVLIDGLASIAEYRDPETGGHVKRTQNYVKALAVALRDKGLYLSELTEENIGLMYMSVPLHDIGKVGINDDILLKPGKLTNEEFDVMKEHTVLGHEVIARTKGKLKDSSFLDYADLVAYSHQEKWDGSGYPRGLKGNEIPLIGRLMAIADVYDALVNKRVYKEAYTHEKALEIIIQGKGHHFEPVLVDTLLEIDSTFKNISIAYTDTESELSYSSLLSVIKEGVIKNVLVVDDSRVIRSIVANQLEALGFKVHTAINGKEGLEVLKDLEFDLILTDIEMPVMDGYEFVKEMIDSKVKKNMIVLAITASDYNLTHDRALNLGFDGFLLKPLDLGRFENKIEEILKLRE